ncbi:MAG: nitroreductase family protein [Pseudomonadota bacterium]
MQLYEVMRTTFAAREFTDEPVTDEQIHNILENARFAPSGGNRQGWKVILVRDQATRAKLRPLVEPGMKRYFAQVAAGEFPWNTIIPTKLSGAEIAATELPQTFIDNLLNAPVMLCVYVDLKVVASFDQGLDRVGVVSGCSIYPFVWNILLAARNEGLGGTPTTWAAACEDQLSEILGVPSDYAFSAMIPLGHPVKQLTKLKRKPVSDFATIDHFDGKAFSYQD